PEHPLDSPEFIELLSALADAEQRDSSHVEVLTNGSAFYEAELAAIAAAKRSINLEAYIFQKDQIGRRFVDALAARARAGVRVNVVVDAIGSIATWDKTFAPLREAGGRVCWYQPIRWYTLKRFNTRTHRELLIIDGEVGFIGGAGIGDNWLTGTREDPPWRDTVVRIHGDIVVGLQTTFAENWLESADEILTGDEYFPRQRWRGGEQEPASDDPNAATGMVVISSPSAGRSTRGRVLFQTLLASAKQSIHINSPYFLPDRSVRRELIDAVKRGVKVSVITPGKHSDHMMTRSASRRRYGELLAGGVTIHEYSPAMIHVKALVIDEIWSVVGSTNFDNRSFGLNDEVNLAVRCRPLARRFDEDFARDLEQSHCMTLEEWNRRSIGERVMEMLGRVIERQQ
ncbi:MAG TPA: phospholipase D-like domain-containing protein, partial [Tepidisphaeraceae bacterium]|nr:phospholipase D-like domain-containing protein [Tepidisphaeraceae bacterium]